MQKCSFERLRRYFSISILILILPASAAALTGPSLYDGPGEQNINQTGHNHAFSLFTGGIQDGPAFSISIPINTGNRRHPVQGLTRRAWLEIGAVTLTGTGHLFFSALDAQRFFIPLATLGWGSYIFYQSRSDPDFLTRTGLTSAGLGPAFRDASLVAAGSLILMGAYGVRQDNLRLHRDMIPLMLLYPGWGLIQQFLVQGLVAGNLSASSGLLGSKYVITPLTASLFGAVHLPGWELAAGTFAIGLTFTPLYLKHGNLWPLGLYHGWLGAAYYFWVLDRNPWEYMKR